MTAQDAFIEGLYRSEEGELVGYLTKVLGTQELAREVSQDAFAQLHARYRPEQLIFPRAMLFQIATRFAFMQLRERRREHRMIGTAVDMEEAHEVPDYRAIPYDRQVMTEQIANRFAAAIKEIRADLRYAFLMAYVEDKTRAEIARALGISEKGVDKRLTKALKVCREQLVLRDIKQTDFNSVADLVGLLGELVPIPAPVSAARRSPRAAPPGASRKSRRMGAFSGKRITKSSATPADQTTRCREVASVPRGAPISGGSPASSKRARIAVQTLGSEPRDFANFAEGLRAAVAAARAGRRVKVITFDKERARWLIRKILAGERVDWPNGLELTSTIRGTSLDPSDDAGDVFSARPEPLAGAMAPGSYDHRTASAVAHAT